MNNRIVWIVWIITAISGAFCVGWFVGEKSGTESGARQMARHILNPAFKTDRFDAIMDEERGDGKDWEQRGYNRAWVDYEEGFAHGRRSQHDYKPVFQTSEFQWGD